jgi:uncharacterized protein (TIGR02594 family)
MAGPRAKGFSGWKSARADYNRENWLSFSRLRSTAQLKNRKPGQSMKNPFVLPGTDLLRHAAGMGRAPAAEPGTAKPKQPSGGGGLQGGGRSRRKADHELENEGSDAGGHNPEPVPETVAVKPKAVLKKAGWVLAETKFGADAEIFAEFSVPESERHRTLVEFELLIRENDRLKPVCQAKSHADELGRATVKVPIRKPEAADKAVFAIKAKHCSGDWSEGRGTDREVTEAAEVSFARTQISGIHFAKNKSFIAPEYLKVCKDLEGAFAEWRKAHPAAKIVVYGHSERDEEDPRKLAARRAEMAFAFLLGDLDTWKRVAKEERWGVWEQQAMLQSMGFYHGKVDGITGGKTRAAIRDFIAHVNAEEGKNINPQLGFSEEYIRVELYRVYIQGGKRAVRLPSQHFRTVSGYPYVGCGSVNRYQGGDALHAENRRATFLLIEESANFPAEFPCRPSNAGPCETECQQPGARAVKGFGCKFYDEMLAGEKAGAPIESGPDEETVYISYKYTLVEAVAKQMALKPKPQKNAGAKWIDAPEAEVESALDSVPHEKGAEKYQFLDLSRPADLTEKDLDAFLKGKGVLEGQGKAFLEAAEAAKISEVYGVAHACLETGHGTSELARGVAIDGETYHNMFGIHAFDKTAIKSGSEYAKKMGWDSPEKAVRGGIEWIAKNFIHRKEGPQHTLYDMRWNPAKPGQHQYATDLKWALAQSSTYKKFYDAFPDAKKRFEIPRYRGQPDWEESGAVHAQAGDAAGTGPAEGEAPWMAFALAEAARWKGADESVITKTINYHKEVGVALGDLNGTDHAWCASFANYCLKQAGFAVSKQTARARSFKSDENFIALEEPQYGAIACIADHHVCFVVAKDKDGVHMVTLGGNTSNTIKYNVFREGTTYWFPKAYDNKLNTPLETKTAAALNATIGVGAAGAGTVTTR